MLVFATKSANVRI